MKTIEIEKGRFVSLDVCKDLAEFLHGYEDWAPYSDLNDGFGVYTREGLAKYADINFFDPEDRPSQNVLDCLNEILNKYPETKIFLIR